MLKNFICACTIVAGLAGSADTRFACGRWQVRFSDKDEKLTLSHADRHAEIEGTLHFEGPAAVTGAGVGKDGQSCAWRIVSSRDGVPDRLALVDARDNVNGYITFQPNGDEISMLAYHRTAFAYDGLLRFAANVRYRADAYACSLTPRKGDRVLSVRSGPVALAHDDALYSPSCDEALAFGKARLRVRDGSFSLVSRIDLDQAACAHFSARIVKGWYKNRWVPDWRAPDRIRAPRAPTGWLSWNTYFDQAGSKENLDEARFAAKWFKPFGMEIWNIESWQDNSPKLPVARFHNMNLETYRPQFPEGMKWLAGEIKKLGFKPGLWMAPFGTGNKAFYEAHKEWFLHRADGTPISCWNGIYTLDPTVPAAREHLKRIFDIASHDWGYVFFKIDGMSGRSHGYCAHLYERPEIRARFADPTCRNPFALCVKAFREGIGDDRIFLACQGHFTGAEAAYADASRTGADIVHPNQPVKWENILLQARCTVNQFFAHANVFWSDPDCMLVSQDALAREQAQVEATIVALPGQQTFAGDKLAALAPDRIRLIQQALPACPTRPGKLYPLFGHLPVWDLAVARPFGTWHVVALFNWQDEERTVEVDFEALGEPAGSVCVGWEFWTGTYLGRDLKRVACRVPPRAVRLVALHPKRARPQFLSTDRHLTQGAVSVKDVAWRDRTLSVKVDAVGGFPQTLRFAVPEGFAFKGVSSPDAVALKAEETHGGRVVAVTLEAKESGETRLALAF